MASKSEIRSPVYSAIFFRCANVFVAKQPLPLIGDFLIARPGASLSFIQTHCTRHRTEPLSAVAVQANAGDSTRVPHGFLLCVDCSWVRVASWLLLLRRTKIRPRSHTNEHQDLFLCLCSWIASVRESAVSISDDAEAVSQSSGPSLTAQLFAAAPSYLELNPPVRLALSSPPSSFAAQMATSRLTDKNLL